MEVFIEKTGKTLNKEFTGTAKELLNDLEINLETVLVVRDGTLITEDDSVEGAEKVELLSVISGG